MYDDALQVYGVSGPETIMYFDAQLSPLIVRHPRNVRFHEIVEIEYCNGISLLPKYIIVSVGDPICAKGAHITMEFIIRYSLSMASVTNQFVYL